MYNVNELKKRYCFLYENAPLILACFTNGFSLLGHVLGTDDYLVLREEVKKQMGFKETSKCYNFKESHDFIYLMEEAFLGDKKIEDTELYMIINDIRKKDSIYSDLKWQYQLDDIDLRCEVHKFDKAFRILLECVRVFVNAQKAYATKVPNEERNLYFFRKFDVLQRYYEIQRYRMHELNLIDDDLQDFRFNFTLGKIPDMTLVRESDFLLNLAYFGGRTDSKEIISTEDKRELYFKYHDIIPWDSKVDCHEDSSIERPSNTYSCGSSFVVKEENIFFYDNYFYELCPNCKYIVRVDDSLIPKKVSERIKDKSYADRNGYRKNYLLSELSFLDSDNKVLSKIKKSTN